MARLGRFWRRFTGWLANLLRLFFGWITVPRAVALLLGLLGVLIAVGGYLYRYCACQNWPNLVIGWEQLFLDFYANVATTLVGITIVVLTIDLLNERRAEQQLKAQLIREMGSTDNGIALRAVRELRAHGWLEDGSLRRAILQGANLQGADLDRADLQDTILAEADLRKAQLSKANLHGANLQMANLQGANLFNANLHGANLQLVWLQGTWLDKADLYKAEILHDSELVGAKGLIGARMSDGGLYNGRFNLSGDIRLAKERDNVDIENPKALAHWYGVSLEGYLAGQEWARENLTRSRDLNLIRLQYQLGLGFKEVPVRKDDEQPTGPEITAPQQSAEPPISSELPAPVMPAQSLLSFTVRRLIGLFWPFGR